MKVAIAHPDRATVEQLQLVLRKQADIRIAWCANTAERTLTECQARRPDLLLLGLDFPGASPGDLTRRLMAESPCSILLLNQGCEPCFGRVFEALGQGAADAAVLPQPQDWDREASWNDLLGRFNTLRTLTGHGRKSPEPAREAKPAPAPLVVAIGSSTGGPKALSTIISGLPADLPATVVVVQHLDFHFIAGLAEWLNQSSALPVAALNGPSRLEPGKVWVAGRPEHLIVNDQLGLEWTAEWPDLTIRPAIDIFFKSLARHPAIRGCGVLLTGMGRDGAEGLLAMREAGFHTIAQDEATSVVYGMPKAAFQLGAAQEVLPLDDIAGRIVERIKRLQALSLP